MIVVSVVVLIFVATTAACLRKRRKARKGKAPMKKHAVRPNPEGLAFHKTEHGGEEIDLEVRPHERISTEEVINLTP